MAYNDHIAVVSGRFNQSIITFVYISGEKNIEADNIGFCTLINIEDIDEVSIYTSGPCQYRPVLFKSPGINTDYLDIASYTSRHLIKLVAGNIIQFTEQICQCEQENKYPYDQSFDNGQQFFSHQIMLPFM